MGNLGSGFIGKVGRIITPFDPLGIFAKPPEPPTLPTPEPVPVMPTPDDEAAKRARAKSVARQKSRSGRVSTIFTSGLGG